MSKDYERKVQTSETFIEVALIRLLIAPGAQVMMGANHALRHVHTVGIATLARSFIHEALPHVSCSGWYS